MIQHEGDRVMCLEGSSHCGDFKSRGFTCTAMQVDACCLECRCAIPTNSEKSVPFIVNCFGFTLLYQWAILPCSFLSTIGELKRDTHDNQEPWCDCDCYNSCDSGVRDEVVTVTTSTPTTTSDQAGVVAHQPSAASPHVPREQDNTNNDATVDEQQEEVSLRTEMKQE